MPKGFPGTFTHNYTGYRNGCRCDICKAGERNRAKPKQVERKVLREELKDKPCLDCGVKYPPYVLQYDHVRGPKDFQLSNNFYSKPLDTLYAEIEKCDLVCANCHAIRTHNRMVYMKGIPS